MNLNKERIITFNQLRLSNFIIDLLYAFTYLLKGKLFFVEINAQTLDTIRSIVLIVGWYFNYSILFKILKKDSNKPSN